MITQVRHRTTPPQPTRLGFDYGWLFLGPTFLNLGVPVVVVDHAFIGDAIRYGLEPFGSRDPLQPLPLTKIMISWSGCSVLLRTRTTNNAIASTSPRTADTAPCTTFTSAALFVGNTYELESTWATLWSMYVGLTPVLHPTTKGDR